MVLTSILINYILDVPSWHKILEVRLVHNSRFSVLLQKVLGFSLVGFTNIFEKYSVSV